MTKTTQPEAIPAPPADYVAQPLSERERTRIASWNRPARPGAGAGCVTVPCRVRF